jgi:hypothetical protein
LEAIEKVIDRARAKGGGVVAAVRKFIPAPANDHTVPGKRAAASDKSYPVYDDIPPMMFARVR